ncbi:hypothetical protein ASG40_06355 [Methylobacterium sp. Leaf399]|uniref:hypothetical protein n=1 Tax=Methylobacterium sp. Leaf399 TaxID=1736364 RepID=UPI0007019187|nr:hypothetical protein [Methylobacterium sp. Leaf399]KQT14912.1 hypothetical protein ASG40_06355 [Methylobacterium sp. Leaf399]
MVPSIVKRSVWRPITAVIVLYAFVLQGMLGGMLPLSMIDHTGVLCAEGVAAAGDGEGPVKVPAHHAASCCIAAFAATDAGGPLPAMAMPAWPPRTASPVVPRPETPAAARAPPGSTVSARGPPTV